jgi:hypothetical protein
MASWKRTSWLMDGCSSADRRSWSVSAQRRLKGERDFCDAQAPADDRWVDIEEDGAVQTNGTFVFTK